MNPVIEAPAPTVTSAALATPRRTAPRVVRAGRRAVRKADGSLQTLGRFFELAVRSVVHGEPVKNVEALANPAALEQFRARPELQS